MPELLRVGTRRSLLARAQTELVARALREAWPELRLEIIPVLTEGDRPGPSAPSTDFTDAIDRRIALGELDLGVHSAKDLPARLPAGIRVGAYPRRADDRDCLVLRATEPSRALPQGARVGTSSPRRRAQWLRARPDCAVVPLRGNVDTRLRSLDDGHVDAVLLARAGLVRLGRADRVSVVLDRRRFLPAPGQGALAVTLRTHDAASRRLVAALDHAATRDCLEAERAVANGLGADCELPLGALAVHQRGRLRLRAEVVAPDGRRTVRRSSEGRVGAGAAVGRRVAEELEAAGALDLGSPRADP